MIYTLVDSILLRLLPYARQDRLMRISGSTSEAFAAIAGYGADTEWNGTDSDTPDRIFGASITVNALDALGIRPAAGVLFSADDAVAGEDHDVVLSYSYWRERYGAEPSAVALAAAWIPARRAAGVDPMVALRGE